MTIRTITFDTSEWQVVPKNPVPAMIESGANEVISPLPTAGAKAGAVYIAMLAAAPEPPAQQPRPAGYLYTWVPSGAVTFRACGEGMGDPRGYKVEPVYRHPPAQQPMTNKQAHAIAEEVWDEYGIPRWQTLRIIRDTELHHGIGKDRT